MVGSSNSLKNKKLVDLFHVLERYMARFPEDQDITVRMSINEEGVASGLEARYHMATNKLPNLTYGISLLETVASKSNIRPGHQTTNSIGFRSFDYENMEDKEIVEQGELYKSWVVNQTVRELSETLSHYLLELYEFCNMVVSSNEQLTPEMVVKLKKDSIQFEKMGLKDRLKILRKRFKVRTAHVQEVLSFYAARNTFAHWDGVVQEKDCNPKGKFILLWPVNSYKMRKRETGKLVRLHKAPKPWRCEDYSETVIDWFAKPEKKEFEAGDQISLSTEDAHTLTFFYINVFQELQKSAIEFSKKHDIPVREFEEYGIKIGVNTVVEYDDEKELSEK